MSTQREVNAGGKPVVTLWETFGANMEQVGRRVADLLAIPFHDQGISSAELASAVSGETEQSALDRLLYHMGDPTRVMTWLYNPTPTDQLLLRDMVAQNTRQVLRIAGEGGVLLGRNGAFILRDMPNVLHVKLDGPVADRVNQAALDFEISDEAAGAMQQVEDRLRVDLSVYLYGYRPTDINHYDLVVNTSRLGVEASAQLIAHAAMAKTTAKLA